MSLISGLLVFDGPVYRGNAKKTIFTRGNGSNDIVLPGKIGGSAQAMMSAFTGFWENRRNPKYSNNGLLEQLWQQLYAEKMPPNLISNVTCKLDNKIAASEPHFDLKMGIAVDRDSMTQAKDQNFRLESVYKGSQFDFSLTYDEARLNAKDKSKFAYLIEEMVQGRFWFGAQKSAGLGKCHLVLDDSSKKRIDGYKNSKQAIIQLNPKANYIFIHLSMTPDTPLLVSWPWGNKDEKGNRDTWVDSLVEDTQNHKDIMKQVISGNAHTWNDVKRLPGGSKFESTHQRRGQAMDLGQLKRNFPKAVQNDDTLMNFLQGYRNKAHEEIDREPHIDFREANGQVTRGKPYDQIFYRSLSWDKDKAVWKILIPGNTIKGAFRVKAQQILRTLHNGKGCGEKTPSHQNRFCDDRFCPVCGLFGRQGQIATVFCSDARLEFDSKLLDDKHFSYDQIHIDPKTGKSLDNSKLNFLYAYGKEFPFKSTLVLKNLDMRDLGQFGFLMHLLREFESGAIPFGGKKTLGFGGIHGKIDKIEILCGPGSQMERKLRQWNISSSSQDQLWQRYEIPGDQIWKNKQYATDLQQNFSKLIGDIKVPEKPFKTRSKYISHRQYSKLCGVLNCELEVLRPLHIKESGEPSFQSEDAFAYDFFAVSPPKNEKKQPINQREYVIPASTIKGTVRSIYNLISQKSCSGCSSINTLCDTCQLFGWVGKAAKGENALMGRLTFEMARPLEDLKFHWYGLNFGYKGEKSFSVSNTRIFPHADFLKNPAVSSHGNAALPNNIEKNKTLNRFVLPGAKFLFQIGFTNLEKEELQKLIWAVQLENGWAHKMGRAKAVGFGSCKITIKDASLIDWKKRFSTFDGFGVTPLDLNTFTLKPSQLNNYGQLKEALTFL